MGVPFQKTVPEDYDPAYPLPDPRYEDFAQYLSDGMSQIGAYEAAGFVPQKANASIMAHKPFIQARVEWLTKKKAEDANVSFAGQVVVDLEKVNADAPKMSPEWFLYQVMQIAEGEESKDPDKLKALQMGAEWMGYFKKPRNSQSSTKDTEDDDGRSLSKSRRRIAAGKQGALSRYSSLVDGLGHEAKEASEDGRDGSDYLGGDDEAEEDGEER